MFRLRTEVLSTSVTSLRQPTHPCTAFSPLHIVVTRWCYTFLAFQIRQGGKVKREEIIAELKSELRKLDNAIAALDGDSTSLVNGVPTYAIKREP